MVFMYDDIAKSKENPRPGVIINSPHGEDVYNGAPKGFFLAAVLGPLNYPETAYVHWRFACGRITLEMMLMLIIYLL